MREEQPRKQVFIDFFYVKPKKPAFDLHFQFDQTFRAFMFDCMCDFPVVYYARLGHAHDKQCCVQSSN